MKIVVIGGSGLIGSKLVTKLRERGHETLAASPASGVNTLTGQGLAAALEGASVVTDVSDSPLRRRGGAGVFRDVDPQPPRRRISRRRRAPRGAVSGGDRPPVRQWLRPGEDRPGEADQGLPDPLLDRPMNSVTYLRICDPPPWRSYSPSVGGMM